jgi:hypothetical protein
MLLSSARAPVRGSLRRQPAIDDQFRANHVRGIFAGKEAYNASYFFGSTDP